jgi:hypothetical protein
VFTAYLTQRSVKLSIWLALLATLASKSAFSDPHAILGCTVISEPGSYLLAADIVVDETCVNPEFPGSGTEFDPTGLAGITILASDVELNLGGHTVYGNPGGYSDTFFSRGVTTSFNPQSNVHIKNGRINGNGTLGQGVYLDVIKQAVVTNVESVHNASEGMLMQTCELCSVTGSRFAFNGSAGVQTVFAGRDGDGNGVDEGGISFHGNEFSDNPNAVGLTMTFFPGAHEIIGNSFERNAVGIGEFLGVGVPGHIIQANRISGNLLGGILFCSVGNTIRANRVQNNGDVGIAIQGFCIDFGDGVAKDNLIQANRVVGTAGIDLVGTCDNVFKANTFETDSEGDGPQKGCIR